MLYACGGMDAARFFCASLVMNAPSQNANRALVNAVHKVANIKLKNALNIARQAANATGAEKNRRIAELEEALRQAKMPVMAATSLAPNRPAETSTRNAELAAHTANTNNAAKAANQTAVVAAVTPTAANNNAARQAANNAANAARQAAAAAQTN